MPASELTFEERVARAAEHVARSEALLITAGAGMGVDSGLPDFRGDQGFWRAYPPYAALGLSFQDLANPRWFRRDPALAWGFYGHRLGLYRATTPHGGFAILRRWAERAPHGAFVFTSNVDGQFERAGFDPTRIVECHGAIEHWQCTQDCGVGIFPAGDTPSVDPSTFRASPPLPSCVRCSALARPAILMFGDGDWDATRTDAQHARLTAWWSRVRGARTVIVECGAGTAVPSVRAFGERLTRDPSVTLVRINVREPEVPDGDHVGIAEGALATLTAIDALVTRRSSE